jgi:hypothetical protein
MRILRFGGLLFLLNLSCNKTKDCSCVPPPYDTYYLKATVSQTVNLDCGKPVLDFDSSEFDRVQAITSKNDMRYVIDQLPAVLNIQDNKLWVFVRNLNADEEFVCTAMGPAYPHLKFLNAASRQ